MLVRIWRSTFNASEEAKLRKYANDVSLPVLSSRPGNCGVLFFSDEDLWTTITLWDSQASIDQLADDRKYHEIVNGIMALRVLGEDQTTEIMPYQGGTI